MATTWEYMRVSANATTPDAEGGSLQKARAEATSSWIAKLNEHGATGWELVSERFVLGGSRSPADPYWAEYVGTMKRQGSPL